MGEMKNENVEYVELEREKEIEKETEKEEKLDPVSILSGAPHWINAICIAAGIRMVSVPSQTDMWKEAAKTLAPLARSFVLKDLPAEEPVGAKAHAFVSEDNESAYIFVFPPLHGGEHIGILPIFTELKEKGINFGLLQSVMSEVVKNRDYCKFIQVARAQQPVRGEDGWIKELVDPDTSVKYIEDERGNIDFKNLNFINNIVVGIAICEVIPPTAGVDGTDVRRNPIPALPGKEVELPIGRNVIQSEEEPYLLSGIEGNLTYRDGKYHVDNLLVIKGSIDVSTGNLDFVGDIQIAGDVHSGFSVKAGGTIMVGGVVEGGTLTAGQDIILAQGANGTKSSLFTAGGDIKAKFLEHCNLTCGGDVSAGAIIGCDIASDGSITATSGIGAIIGGTLRAHQTITANAIGNKTGVTTTLSLGATREMLQKRDNMNNELATSKDTLLKLRQNMKFLDTVHEKTEKQKELERVFKTQLPLYELKVKELSVEVEEFVKTIRDYSPYYIKANTLHPTIAVSFGSRKRKFSDEYTDAVITRSPEGEILIQG